MPWRRLGDGSIWVGWGWSPKCGGSGPGVRCPTPFFAPLRLMFCPEEGLSRPCLGESQEPPPSPSPSFSTHFGLYSPFPPHPSSLFLPGSFPHPCSPLSFTSASTNPPEWVGISPCWFPLRTDAQGQGRLSPQMWGVEGGGLCQTRGCPGSAPGQTRCEELWAPGREGMKPRAGQRLQGWRQL